MKHDVIEMYKIMRGIDGVNAHLLPREGESRTRGHRFKLRGGRFNRIFFFLILLAVQ